ncbi:o-succinylbenzoate synthase [Synechococcus sp. A10-1-5-1]|uniref:o-succinylbenzoate synthase n=1 Tax=Synechococcus sp. A10-1-5-1 TaxID=2936507 RepID=UPI002001ABCB|nr:o-succinylbenzoate synthase [Synechococcus sp. A10-1-5-1]UPM49604.1 o-succinylbenzoate synthase [Synechococcus sp. A10-1-5-1]
MELRWRPYSFRLPSALVSAQGRWLERRGWLLRLEVPDGRLGWGEVADLPAAWRTAAPERPPLQEALAQLPAAVERSALEAQLPALPSALACGLGMALAELDGLGGEGWLPAPASAELLPAGQAVLPALEALLQCPSPEPKSVKWKVAVEADAKERVLLERLLEQLPANWSLRLDANGAWDRSVAQGWAERLQGESRLQWLEQPLDPADLEGLQALAQRVPVALDESLRQCPECVDASWPGWRVHRPLAEADPRPLLEQLQRGVPRLMVSTAFETGIGRRFLHHLAGLQALGPTPVAPGLAPAWQPEGPLFSADPQQVWEAAAA